MAVDKAKKESKVCFSEGEQHSILLQWTTFNSHVEASDRSHRKFQLLSYSCSCFSILHIAAFLSLKRCWYCMWPTFWM